MAAVLIYDPLIGEAYESGDKLTAYETGTTTVVTLYQDSALTTAHTSPVVADSSGRFAAIYADATGGNLKIKVTDSADVERYTVDPFVVSDLTSLETDVAALQTTQASINGRLTTAESEIDTLQTESADYESRISANETDITALQAVGSTFAEAVLYNNLTAPTSGDITLSADWTQYNALLVVATFDGRTSSRTPFLFTKGLLDTSGTFTCAVGKGGSNNAAVSFSMKNTTTMTIEASHYTGRVVRVIGVTF